MKAEKRGGKAKNSRMVNVPCSICGIDMDCPDPKPKNDMLTCDRCMELLEKGYSPEELKMTPQDIAKHIPRCEKVAKEMQYLAFDDAWEQVHEIGIEHFDHETLAKEFYNRGAVSMLLLMISLEMPPEMLDQLEEVSREAKKMRVVEKNNRGE